MPVGKRTLTVELPQGLFDELQERAARTHRSVEDEAVLALAATVSDHEAMPSDLAATLASLHTFTDSALLRLARTRIAPDDAARLERLGDKRQQTGPTPDEMLEVEELIERRDRARVIRAEAAVLLKQRGHDVSALADGM